MKAIVSYLTNLVISYKLSSWNFFADIHKSALAASSTLGAFPLSSRRLQYILVSFIFFAQTVTPWLLNRNYRYFTYITCVQQNFSFKPMCWNKVLDAYPDCALRLTLHSTLVTLYFVSLSHNISAMIASQYQYSLTAVVVIIEPTRGDRLLLKLAALTLSARTSKYAESAIHSN